ncbi:hypothetical protein A7J57_10460 [Agrobacterium tumefaciens]|uniref:Uncharacterized protein n=2 Tax=Agrobacterium tumefaciens TaxID=358 RepID=A0A176X3L5_AGRTU|nr:hypothetical protein A7J57_10460 [Agrobacterium tumefaciens]
MAKSPVEFLRDYVTNGVPSSGAYNPPKRDLREYLLWLEGQTGGGGGGGGADYSDDIAALDSRMTTVEQEVAERMTTVEQEVAERMTTVEQEVAERTASASHRPGDAPTLFSGDVAGSADQQAAQALGTVVVTASGATLSLPGGAQLWTRQDTDVEQGVLATAEWRIVRLVNSSDPLSDAVDLGITWLDKNKNRLGADHRVRRVAIQTFDGVVSHRISVSKGHEDADLVAPDGAVYARPYVRTYGDPSSRTGVITLALSRGGGTPGPAGSDGAPPSYEISDDGYMIRWSQPDGSVGPWLDIGSAAAEARAEADRAEVARSGAESARDQAAGFVNDIVSEKEVPITGTRNGMESLQFPPGMNSLETRGFAIVGDGGRAHYKRVSLEPSGGLKVRSADRFLPNGSADPVNGGWWELDEPEIWSAMAGVPQDGVSPAGDAMVAARDYCVLQNKKLRLEPVVFNMGSSLLDTAGLTVEATYRGYRNSNGTILRGTGTVLRQGNASAVNTHHSVHNIRVETTGSGPAVDWTYLLFASASGIDVFAPNGIGIDVGSLTSAGSLWPKMKSVNVWEATGAGVRLRGQDWINELSWEDSWFSQSDPNGHAVEIKTSGGLGAVANTFKRCEFKGKGSGILLGDGGGGVRSLLLEQPYFECEGPAIRSVNSTNHVHIIGGALGSRKNTVRPTEACIHHEGTGSLRVNWQSPFIYLPQASDTDGVRLFSKNGAGPLYPSVSGVPRADAVPTGWRFEYEFTPTVPTSGFSLGNGALTAFANVSGRRVKISFRLVVGSTTVLGTGLFIIQVPFSRAQDVDSYGIGNLLTPGAGNRLLQVASGSGGQIYFRRIDISTGYYTDVNANLVPLSPVVEGMVINGSIEYAI